MGAELETSRSCRISRARVSFSQKISKSLSLWFSWLSHGFMILCTRPEGYYRSRASRSALSSWQFRLWKLGIQHLLWAAIVSTDLWKDVESRLCIVGEQSFRPAKSDSYAELEHNLLIHPLQFLRKEEHEEQRLVAVSALWLREVKSGKWFSLI